MKKIVSSTVLEVLESAPEPVSLPDLQEALGLRGEDAGEQVLKTLRKLVRAGQVVRNRRNRFALSRRLDMVTGRVIGHRDGFGFIAVEDSGGDLYLSPREARKVLHGDRVLARITAVDHRGRRQGKIEAVVNGSTSEIVGHLHLRKKTAYVVPDDNRINHEILIDNAREMDVADGQIVVVRLNQHPFNDRHAAGSIIEVLGDHLAPGMQTDIAIRKYELPLDWPENVSKPLKKIKRRGDPDKAMAGRRDLTALPMVTIDGADARDFDDAVYCEKNGRSWRLLVAIADVSAYVKSDSVLDEEAFKRGNSVYFPDRVIPMLPELLSNGICSLNPDVNRLSLVCEMKVGPSGRVLDYDFYSAVIKSQGRLTYESVGEFLKKDKSDAIDEKLYEPLHCLGLVYQKLHNARFSAGAIDLDIPEAQIQYHEGRIAGIGRRERNDAHRLIEECMLAANRCAAEYLGSRMEKAMYRVHEAPEGDDLANLRRFLSGMGITLAGGDKPSVRDFQKALKAGQADETRSGLLQMVMLRSLKQAVYSSESDEHFALGFSDYTHFTSPIRRYSDLIVHRLIKSTLTDEKHKRIDVPADQLGHIADHCSFTERRADDATRDVIQWLKAEYMSARVGEVFDGTVTGVTDFGLFVQLDEVFVDGLVHISELGNDYYHFDPARFQLQGERSGVTHCLGDKMKVKVMRVDLDEAKIDFLPVGTKPRRQERKPRRKTTAKWSRIDSG